MRSAILIATATVLSAVALGWLVSSDTTAAPQDLPDDAFEWRTDLDAAREEARETGRPLLVVFR